MTDYLTQCDAITAEKKVWRWRTAVSHKAGGMCRISYREDHPSFHGVAVDSEYLGDADGNPIPAMLGPQELWDRHGLYVSPDSDGWDVFECVADGFGKSVAINPTYAAALAEANRLAGGA